ncbi:hypothetical protein L6R21_12570 [bacterium]|nr:hypothetical protein [bacterium]
MDRHPRQYADAGAIMTLITFVFSADFGDDMSFAVTLSDNMLTLAGDSAFDFDNNGTDEPASVVIVLQKS